MPSRATLTWPPIRQAARGDHDVALATTWHGNKAKVEMLHDFEWLIKQAIDTAQVDPLEKTLDPRRVEESDIFLDDLAVTGGGLMALSSASSSLDQPAGSQTPRAPPRPLDAGAGALQSPSYPLHALPGDGARIMEEGHGAGRNGRCCG